MLGLKATEATWQPPPSCLATGSVDPTRKRSANRRTHCGTSARDEDVSSRRQCVVACSGLSNLTSITRPLVASSARVKQGPSEPLCHMRHGWLPLPRLELL